MTLDINKLYTEDRLTLREIGALLGVSQVTISKRLKQLGVSRFQRTWVDTRCNFCLNKLTIQRCRWVKHKDFYCDRECQHKRYRIEPYLACVGDDYDPNIDL
jgi:hypothetical protein